VHEYRGWHDGRSWGSPQDGGAELTGVHEGGVSMDGSPARADFEQSGVVSAFIESWCSVLCLSPDFPDECVFSSTVRPDPA
jgi:hypothetical protein